MNAAAGTSVVVLILVFLAIILVAKSIKIVRPYQKGIVERLGRYQRTVDSGLNVILPFFDTLIKVDMRERVIDVPPQGVITKDNVVVEVDAVIYMQVTDPMRSTYEIANYVMAAMKLAQTNLRNIVGDLELDQSLTSRDSINAQLRDVLDAATDKWGVKVNRVELQKIDPPLDITEAMSRQMKAERDKRAVILEAEGVRQSQIARAEGEKQKRILEAEGEAGAVRAKADAERYRQIAVAEGQGQAITTVFEAIHAGKPTNELITLRYFDVLQKLADGSATKIFLPYEISGIISSVAAMIEGTQASKEANLSVPPRPGGQSVNEG
jgi:regulator of protease activity HflC (stomatin/prohibitin superfamily)